MIVLRLEYKENGKGIFCERNRSNAYAHNYLLKEYVDELARKHPSPYTDSRGDMRQWEEIKDRIGTKFAFTEYALLDENINRLFLQLAMLEENIRVRIINNPEIVWVSESGWQVCFIDKEV